MKSGLLVCSFALNKIRKPELLQELNSEFYSHDGKVLEIWTDVFSSFCQNFSDGTSFEKLEKYFQVIPNSFTMLENEEYRYIIFSVKSGSYNSHSIIQNRKTKKIMYETSEDDAAVHNFLVLVYVPKNTEEVNVTKGLLAFQSIGPYGIKTITAQALSHFFSSEYSLVFKTGNVFAGEGSDFIFSNGKLKKITVVRNQTPHDMSEKMGLNPGKEELSFINPKVSDHGKFTAMLNSKRNGVYEVGDLQFEDIIATVKIGNTTRTASIEGFKNFSMTFDLPESIYLSDGSTVNFDNFVKEAVDICSNLSKEINFAGGINL